MSVVFIVIFFSCPWRTTYATHSKVKPGLFLFLRKRMDPLLFSDGPFHSPETCMRVPDMFLQCSQPLDSKCPPRSPPSMHLVSGLGDWTLYINSRVSNPASFPPLASSASQMRMRKKCPCLLFSSFLSQPEPGSSYSFGCCGLRPLPFAHPSCRSPRAEGQSGTAGLLLSPGTSECPES